ncbi:MAG: hypothetical protein ABSG65_13500 [Bryobacteraceae bacterium]
MGITTTPAATLRDLQIPLVFGVTGHRDLEHENLEKLEVSVRGKLEYFRRKYAHTPFILLSPLAEGADRLVARVALEPQIGARLIVPLPMRKDFYEEDFTSPGSLLEFLGLLDRADQSFVLPQGPEAQIPKKGAARDAQYRAVGEFIVRHCQNLIALWDGTGARGEGGTGEIVALQTEGIPAPNANTLELPEAFPAIWVVTPHRKNETPKVPEGGALFDVVDMYPAAFRSDKKEAEDYYGRIFGRVDDFNKNVASRREALRGDIEESKSYLMSTARQRDLSSDERLALERYGMADALAIRFQKWTKRTQYALHWFVFFTFFFFVFFAHPPSDSIETWVKPWIWLLPSGALLSLAGSLILVNRRLQFDINYQDFRAVAEGLRVAFFWRLAGVKDYVPEHYLRSQRSELDWIRTGLRGWQIHPTDDQQQPGRLDDLKLILKHWVRDQRDYFRRKREQNEDKARHNQWVIRSLITFAVAMGVILFVSALLDHKPSIRIELLLVETLLAAGALWHNCNKLMAYEQHAKQYGRMYDLFAYASKRISDAVSKERVKEAQELLRELGKQALAENGDWVLIHRERPIELLPP